MGYDQPRSLGDRETGGGAALPIWMGYMGSVLKNVPEAVYTMPDNMVAVHINDEGYRDDNSPLVEYFYRENVPPEHTVTAPSEEIKPADTIRDQLL
jgi:penicillin-binding protein 1A